MKVLVIKCPTCQRKFKITCAAIEDLQDEAFKCPRCHYIAPFPVVFQWNQYAQSTSDQPTVPPPPPTKIVQKGPKTKLATQIDTQGQQASNEQASPPVHKAYLTLPSLKRRILLKDGNFIVGRDSIDSRASIRLAPDRYMSREHARLLVTSNGGAVACHITSFKDNNPVYVNGQAVPIGMMVKLNTGDQIKLGNTLVLFEIR